VTRSPTMTSGRHCVEMRFWQAMVFASQLDWPIWHFEESELQCGRAAWGKLLATPVSLETISRFRIR
jgi:hypothetical protein